MQKNGVICFMVLPYKTELFKKSHKNNSVNIINSIEKKPISLKLSSSFRYMKKKYIADKTDVKYIIDTIPSVSHK